MTNECFILVAGLFVGSDFLDLEGLQPDACPSQAEARLDVCHFSMTPGDEGGQGRNPRAQPQSLGIRCREINYMYMQLHA